MNELEKDKLFHIIQSLESNIKHLKEMMNVLNANMNGSTKATLITTLVVLVAELISIYKR